MEDAQAVKIGLELILSQPARREATQSFRGARKGSRRWAEQEAGADGKGRLEVGRTRGNRRGEADGERPPAGFL